MDSVTTNFIWDGKKSMIDVNTKPALEQKISEFRKLL